MLLAVALAAMAVAGAALAVVTWLAKAALDRADRAGTAEELAARADGALLAAQTEIEKERAARAGIERQRDAQRVRADALEKEIYELDEHPITHGNGKRSRDRLLAAWRAAAELERGAERAPGAGDRGGGRPVPDAGPAAGGDPPAGGAAHGA